MSHPLFDMLRDNPEPALNADHPAPFEAGGWKKPQGNDVKPPRAPRKNVHNVSIETPEQYIEQEIGLDGKVKK